MSVMRLLRMELIKLRRRTAFFAMLVLFVAGTVLIFGMRAALATGELGAAVPFALPAAAIEIQRTLQPLIVFFSFVTIVNLTAPEYQWRTARQNVIDGLSRDQFFAAKLILVPLAVLLFFVLGYGIALAIAAMGGIENGFIAGGVAKAMLGGLVAAIGFSCMALVAAVGTRHTAGAIAIVLGYMMFGELIIRAMLHRSGEALARAVFFLPANVFDRLGSLGQYMSVPQVFPSNAERVATPLLAVTALGYIVVFCVGAYAIVRRQDL